MGSPYRTRVPNSANNFNHDPSQPRYSYYRCNARFQVSPRALQARRCAYSVQSKVHQLSTLPSSLMSAHPFARSARPRSAPRQSLASPSPSQGAHRGMLTPDAHVWRKGRSEPPFTPRTTFAGVGRRTTERAVVDERVVCSSWRRAAKQRRRFLTA